MIEYIASYQNLVQKLAKITGWSDSEINFGIEYDPEIKWILNEGDLYLLNPDAIKENEKIYFKVASLSNEESKFFIGEYKEFTVMIIYNPFIGYKDFFYQIVLTENRKNNDKASLDSIFKPFGK